MNVSSKHHFSHHLFSQKRQVLQGCKQDIWSYRVFKTKLAFFLGFFFFKFLWCKHMYCWNALKWILKLKRRDIKLHIFLQNVLFQKCQKWTVDPCTNFYQYYVICKEVLWEVYYICFFAEKMNRAISITGCLWSNIA